MGIPKFFRWISERYPLCSELVTEHRVPEFDCLYLDMNGVIHQCSHSSDQTLITARDETEIFLNVFTYVTNLFDKIRPKKLFFLAVDGVAPRAKMNQQRSRRFRSAAERVEAEQKEAKKASVLNDPQQPTQKYFDTNCITPGTDFMHKLSWHLRYLIRERINQDPNWQSVKIIFSGPEVPGEGEHKVMEWIRSERAKPDHEANLKHCLYGLDADLIMLGLLSHEPHFALLREEVSFGKKSKVGNSTGAAGVRFYLMYLGLMREYLEMEFKEISTKLKFQFDFERVLDDFVLLSLFVGNDFLPHLPHLHINENAIGLLFDAYKRTLPSLSGYLNDCGRVDLKGIASVLSSMETFEKSQFESECADELELLAISGFKKESGSSLPPITPSQLVLFKEFVNDFLRNPSVLSWEIDPESISRHPEDRVFVAGLAKDFRLILELSEEHAFVLRKCLDEEAAEALEMDEQGNVYCNSWEFTLDTAKIVNRYERRPIVSELSPPEVLLCREDELFVEWKSRYYAQKMELRTREQLDSLLEAYCEGLEWVMRYYFEGVASWGWYFKFHYAPFMSDVISYLQSGKYKNKQFDLGSPFKPLEQLMSVLPSLSSALVPTPLAELMTNPLSLIAPFYPLQFESDLNGKKNSWEAVVKIPFIDEKLLLETVQQKYALLSGEEGKRNCFGPAVTFEYTPGKSCVLAAPSVGFPALEECHVLEHVIKIADPPRESLRKGLTPGAEFGFKGPATFPSLAAIPSNVELNGSLQHLDVSVFPGAFPSKSLTLALILIEQSKPNLKELFKCKIWHFNWPHLQEGNLFAVTDGQSIWTPNGHLLYSDAALSGLLTSTATATSFSALAENLEISWCKKKGVVLAGGVQAVAFLRPFKHLSRSSNGAIRKVFAEGECIPCPVQLLITNLPNLDDRLIERESLSVADFCALPDKTVMFVGSKAQFFGRIGQIERAVDEGKALRMTLNPIPDVNRLARCKGDLLDAIAAADNLFLDAKDAAQQSGIPPWLLSKITSTMQVFATSNTNQPSNVGFSVKFEGKSLAAPGLARRLGPGQWQYSRELVFLVQKYRAACPKLFDGLMRMGSGADRPTAAQLQITPAELTEARNWIKENVKVPTLRPCQGVSFVSDSTCLSEIAKVVEGLQISCLIKKETGESIVVTPADLITRVDCVAFLNGISSSSQLSIGDVVVCCGDGADGLPFGELGLVVGVFGVEEAWVLLLNERKGVAERAFPGPIAVGSWRAWAGSSAKWMKSKFTGASTRASKPVTVKKTLPFSAAATDIVKPVKSEPVIEEKGVDLLTKIFAAAQLAEKGSEKGSVKNGNSFNPTPAITSAKTSRSSVQILKKPTSSPSNTSTPSNTRTSSNTSSTSSAPVKTFTSLAASIASPADDSSTSVPVKKFTIKKRV